MQTKTQLFSMISEFYINPQNIIPRGNLVRALEVFKQIEQNLYNLSNLDPFNPLSQQTQQINNKKQCVDFFTQIITFLKQIQKQYPPQQIRQKQTPIKLQKSIDQSNNFIKQEIISLSCKQKHLNDLSRFMEEYLYYLLDWTDKSKYNFANKSLNNQARKGIKVFFVFYTLIFQDSIQCKTDRTIILSTFMIDFAKFYVILYKKGFRKNLTFLQIILKIWRINNYLQHQNNVIRQLKKLITFNNQMAEIEEEGDDKNVENINIKLNIDQLLDQNHIKCMKYSAWLQGQIIDEKNIQKQYYQMKQKQKKNKKNNIGNKSHQSSVKSRQNCSKNIEKHQKIPSSKKKMNYQKKIQKNNLNIQNKDFLPIMIPEQMKLKSQNIKFQSINKKKLSK